MAISYWKGPGAKGDPLQSGDFEFGSNWSLRAVPDAGTSVVLGKGGYTVTVGSSATIQALSVGKGATLATAANSHARIELLNDSTNDGTLAFAGSSLVLDATLTNNGLLAGQITQSADGVSGGAIVNHGLITTLPAGGGGGFLLSSAISNAADGAIRSTGLSVTLLGAVTNSGLVDAAGGVVAFGDLLSGQHGALSNLSNTILTGGAWHASGQGSILLFGTKLTGLGTGTEVTLDGGDAHLTVAHGSDLTFMEDTLTRIDGGATLRLLSAHGFGRGQDLDLHGALELTGGAMSLHSIDTFAGSRLTGFGTVSGAADLEGSVVVAGGALVFTGDVSLEGRVSGQGTLELMGSSNTLLAGSAVSCAALILSGGATRVSGGDLHVAALAIDDAALDLGRQSLRLTGEIELSDARVLGSGSLQLSGHVTSSGSSALTVNVTAGGAIDVTGGSLTFERALSGKGVVSIADAATLEFGAAATVAKTQTIHFDGAGTVAIAAPGQFLASLSGFGDGATLELTGFDADTAKLRWKGDRDGSGGMLKVTDQGETTTLHFADGHYDRSGFETFQFGDGVLGITYHGAEGAVIPHGSVFDADAPVFATLHSMSDLPIGLLALA